ncbi:MAG: Ig-like domain-containing protein [Bacteroidaceae bacterium]|nr:Ig-like domain-containing protein [Bacteroidaceae bacterium]
MENPLKMKHISLLFIAVGLLIFGSCLEDNKRLISIEEDNTVPLHFYARIESQPDSAATKSALSGTSTDAIRKVLWEPADSIYVTNGSTSARFNNVFEENSDVADFSGKIALGTTYYAAFPYGIVSGFEASKFQLTLPTIQPYKVDGVGSESFPMVAQCVDNIFEFKNLCGILVLNLTGNASIDSIRFSGTDDTDKPIKVSGAANVNATYVDIPSLELDSTSVDYVLLNCIGSDGRGVTLSSTTPTPFHIVLPATDYAHFTVVIYSSDRRKMTINSKKPLSIKRSKRTTASNIEYLIDDPEYEFIDLGLSVNWATFNVGAYYPEEFGSYYAWGETTTKSIYNWSTYKYCNGKYNTLTKYCNNPEFGYNGFTDGKDTLDFIDDVARVQWKGEWRIPTIDEFNELRDNCTIINTTLNGVNGYLFTSNVSKYKDKSIFIPTAGYYKGVEIIDRGTVAYYSTNTLMLPDENPAVPEVFLLSPKNNNSYASGRSNGWPIRPVYPSNEWLDKTTISIDKEALSLRLEEKNTLTAVMKYDADTVIYNITWSSDHPEIASVSSNGMVTGLSAGTAIITASSHGKKSTCTVNVNGPVYQYVDLGLSVNWATFNVGAYAPEEYGNYYAWGEIATTTRYESSTSKWWNTSKYQQYHSTLDPEDDVAHVKWGDNWRMPTASEFKELLDYCNVSPTTINGIGGWKFISKKEGYTDKSIFLPYGGYRQDYNLNYLGSNGYYWSSTSCTEGSYIKYYAGYLWFKREGMGDISYNERYIGRNVRPVYPKQNVTSILLNKSEATLAVGKNDSLVATIKDGNNTIQSIVFWSSNNTDIVTVDANGKITAVAIGEAVITAECQGKTATCTVTTTLPEPEYVDLGLSVNWATFNVGAHFPEEHGNYYAWGEINTKSSYTWSNYKWNTGSNNTGFTKYCVDSYYGDGGLVDYLTTLSTEDDAASNTWGGDWRMPSNDEIYELINNCTWVWTTYKDINGYLITSKIQGYTNNNIFLPVTGEFADKLYDNTTEGYYWSNSLSPEGYGKSSTSWGLRINKDYYTKSSYMRNEGFAIRAVTPSETWLNNVSIALNYNSQTVVMRDSCDLIATVKHCNDVINRKVTWSSTNPSIATVSETGVVTGITVGTTLITATCLGKTATCTITVTLPEPKYVDLGLSVNWATFNIGSHFPEESGDYYAWGETEIISVSDWANYKYCNGTKKTLTKYNTIKDYGTVDNVTVLSMVDDVAANVWGGNWRLPTKEEIEELINNCNWTWTTLNDIYGYVVKSTISGYTDQMIFLPAAGYYYDSSHNLQVGNKGYYWSSSLYSEGPDLSWIIATGSNEIKTAKSERITGHSVRPVCTSETWLSNVSISLNSNSQTIIQGSSNTLIATVKHNNDIIDRVVSWSSSNPSIATVDNNGVVIGLSAGSTIVTATCLNKSVSCSITIIEPQYDYVDLGLSVNWATFNVGANNPKEYGDYFAWGEIEPYYETGYAMENPQSHWKAGKTNGYNWSSYKWGDPNNLTKYNTQNDKGIVDNKTSLDLEDDVAHIKWGNNWRMPTKEEWKELKNNCTWTYISDGVNAYRVTSNVPGYEGNSILLPFGGHRYEASLNSVDIAGYYWASSILTNMPGESYSVLLNISKANVDDDMSRCVGYSVRPVLTSGTWINDLSINLNVNNVSLFVYETIELSATVKKGNDIIDREVSWASSNTSIASVDNNGVVTGISEGSAIISATCLSKTVTCIVTVSAPEYVDLGLSVKWATSNVGANNPEEYGDCYAWGEIETKGGTYTWDSYKYDNGTYNNIRLTKYCTNKNYGYNNFVDNKMVLDLEDDVAHVKWGGNWRMPTYAEIAELSSNCTFLWTERNGVEGYLVTSNVSGYTGRSIFLPLQSEENNKYWTSTLYQKSQSSYSGAAWTFKYGESDNIGIMYYDRYNKGLVRPVCP